MTFTAFDLAGKATAVTGSNRGTGAAAGTIR